MRDYRDFIGEILIPEDKLQARIAEMGAEISEDFKGQDNLLLICILRGGVLFLTRPDEKDLSTSCDRVHGGFFLWRWKSRIERACEDHT